MRPFQIIKEEAMKTYYVSMNGITVLVDADGLERWVGFLLDNGHVPTIEKVELVA